MALAALLVVEWAGGCGGDDDCGAGDAPVDGLTLSAGGTSALTLGDVRSSANNDCTPDQSSGPISLTIEATELAPTRGLGLVLCLPRPGEIGAAAISLADPDRIQFVDLFVEDEGGCTLRRDSSREPAGEALFAGFCQDGGHPDGYALSLSGTLPALRTCPGGDPDPITLTASGTAAVSAGSL
jgi:hypothetical protein